MLNENMNCIYYGKWRVSMIITSKQDCTGCSACKNSCPKNAISMMPDNYGFIYPSINVNLCVKCGICKSVCPANPNEMINSKNSITYAAINKNKDIIKKSSSGGAFVAIASYVLENNGVVCGCAWKDDLSAEQIFIDNMEDLTKLQGSKYVQSNIGKSFKKTKKYLEQKKLVFYTGTPCQIAGLKSFLGKKYNNLITADLICHGVPNEMFFKGYLEYLEKNLSGKIIKFEFRDKKYGWRFVGKVTYEKNNKIYEKAVVPINSYYYNYFAHGYIYRDSCYTCKYAGENRQGDFTLGDYWGIEKYHPKINTRNGVSVLLVNSDKGEELLVKLNKYIDFTHSNLEFAKANNGQLNGPMEKNQKREAIFKLWKDGGSQAVADGYYVSYKEKAINIIKNILPHKVKKELRRITSK